MTFKGKCFDTNVLIKFESNPEEIKKYIQEKNIFFPLICKLELFLGYQEQEKNTFKKFFFNVEKILQIKLLNINEESIRFYHDIFWKIKSYP